MNMDKKIAFAIVGVVAYCAVALTIAVLLSSLYSDKFNSFDAGLFHSMAETIRTGMLPYVDFTDNKPPLLFFTLALTDSILPAGSYDMILMAILNVISALLIWKIGRDEYGSTPGYIAGFLFLVAAVAVQGYFMFSEQFVVVFVLAAYLCARNDRWLAAGLLLGCAVGFKQYAIFGIIPFLYLMHTTGSRHYFRFFLSLLAVIGAIFGAVYFWYGQTVFINSVYYTFGIGPDYLAYNFAGGATNMKPSALMLIAIVMVSTAMVLPTLVFSSASVVIHGAKTITDRTLILFVLSFGMTLFVRQYLHYWILMLPFMALLACREFAAKEKTHETGAG